MVFHMAYIPRGSTMQALYFAIEYRKELYNITKKFREQCLINDYNRALKSRGIGNGEHITPWHNRHMKDVIIYALIDAAEYCRIMSGRDAKRRTKYIKLISIFERKLVIFEYYNPGERHYV